jgi:hypothetical protein
MTELARIVKVRIEEGRNGLFYATSPDLEGLLVAEPTMDDLDRAVPEAIAAIYAASGSSMVVTKAEEPGIRTCFSPWVAVPEAQLKAALDRLAA